MRHLIASKLDQPGIGHNSFIGYDIRMNLATTSTASLILFRFTGEDRPGLTASISELLAKFGCSIIDVNQAVIHQSLLLGILVQIPFCEDSERIIREMQDCGNLLQAEVIDELAKEAGVGEEVSAITEAAMRGELDFDESLRKRVQSLAGLSESVLPKIAERLVITEGAERLLTTLRRFGYRTAILSGGFTYFGNYLQKRLAIDHVYANELEIADGKLTGRVIGPIVNAQRKATLLDQLASEEGVDRKQCIAIGDGANDLPMLARAGLGIAFHAKPVVKLAAEHQVSTMGLDAVLYLLGVRDRDLV